MRPPTGGYTSQSSTGTMTVTQMVFTLQAHTRPMEAQVDINNIIIIGQIFWSQICGQATFRTPDTYHPRVLSSVNGLGSQSLMWNQHQLELPKTGF